MLQNVSKKESIVDKQHVKSQYLPCQDFLKRFVAANFLLSQTTRNLLQNDWIFDNRVGEWMLLLVGIGDKILVTFVLMLDYVVKAEVQKMNGVLKSVKVGFEHSPCLPFQSTADIDLPFVGYLQTIFAVTNADKFVLFFCFWMHQSCRLF